MIWFNSHDNNDINQIGEMGINGFYGSQKTYLTCLNCKWNNNVKNVTLTINITSTDDGFGQAQSEVLKTFSNITLPASMSVLNDSSGNKVTGFVFDTPSNLSSLFHSLGNVKGTLKIN